MALVLAALFVPAPAAAEVDGLVPYAAIGYRNGRKLEIQLVEIGWAQVELRTAYAFLEMQEAAALDGVELWIRSGYRTHEHQQWLYEAWRAGWGNKAARPGHSNHQSGRALDLEVSDPRTYAWLEKHARRFGFQRTVRSEPWHWEFTKKPRTAKKKAKKPKRRSKSR